MIDCPSCEKSFNTEHGKNIHHSSVHNKSLVKESTSCEICSNKFEYYPSCKQGKYCESCVNNEDYRNTDGLESQRGLSEEENPNYRGGEYVECEFCNNKKWQSPSELENKDRYFCSTSCLARWRSVKYRGEGNPFWKGGYNLDYSGEWWAVKKKALQRDNYTCQICGATKSSDGRNCDVHHKTPIREFENSEDAHYLENLIVLCRSCHSSVENGDRKI